MWLELGGELIEQVVVDPPGDYRHDRRVALIALSGVSRGQSLLATSAQPGLSRRWRRALELGGGSGLRG